MERTSAVLFPLTYPLSTPPAREVRMAATLGVLKFRHQLSTSMMIGQSAGRQT